MGQGTAVRDVPPHWDVYIAVLSAVLKKPFDVFVSGRMAVLQDPTGAIFCIWEAKQQFYESVFAWHMDSGAYMHIQNGDAFIGGMQSLKDSPQGAVLALFEPPSYGA